MTYDLKLKINCSSIGSLGGASIQQVTCMYMYAEVNKWNKWY